MTSFVYVLQSQRNGRYYIGSTDNLLRRFGQHAAGFCVSTKHLRPLTMVGWRQYASLIEARRQERLLKQKKNRASIEYWLSIAPERH